VAMFALCWFPAYAMSKYQKGGNFGPGRDGGSTFPKSTVFLTKKKKADLSFMREEEKTCP